MKNNQVTKKIADNIMYTVKLLINNHRVNNIILILLDIMFNYKRNINVTNQWRI